jgi:hypothetical protein
MPVSAITAAGSIGSAVIGSNAAKKAAKGSQQAATQANQTATDVYNTNQSNLNPYIQTGTAATNQLAGLLNIGGDQAASQDAFNNYRNSTNYNFVLDQGLKGVATQNAAQYGSGATAKALNNYAQGQAGNSLSGYESMLSGLSSQGLQGASTLGSLGNQYSSQYSSNLIGGQNSANQNNLTAAGQIQGGIGGLSQAYGAYSSQKDSPSATQSQSSYSNPNASSYSSIFPASFDNGIRMPSQYGFNLGGI